MTKKTFLSSLCTTTCLASLVVSIHAQDPAATPAAAPETPATQEAAPTAGTPETPAESTPAPATTPAATDSPTPEQAADSITMPESGTNSNPSSSDGNPLFSEPINLVPPTDEPSMLPDTSEQERRFKHSKTALVSDEIKERIHYRQARSRAPKDPKVVADMERAEAATTYTEKRDALTAYYKAYYAKVIQIDASLKKRVDVDQKVDLQRLNQRRLRAPGEPGGEQYTE